MKTYLEKLEDSVNIRIRLVENLLQESASGVRASRRIGAGWIAEVFWEGQGCIKYRPTDTDPVIELASASFEIRVEALCVLPDLIRVAKLYAEDVARRASKYIDELDVLLSEEHK